MNLLKTLDSHYKSIIMHFKIYILVDFLGLLVVVCFGLRQTKYLANVEPEGIF